ncbi:hypothetical protein [Pseudonocardia sp. NPDC049635]|uniref:hypothetical protein n=1 Tax=Pseudonocardia sp. NPDC049635 TaxID=3155506 RepID=UPI00340249C2
MAEHNDPNELVWAKHSSNGVPKQMKRAKFNLLASTPGSAWELTSAPEQSGHQGIVAVAPAGEHPSGETAPVTTTKTPRGSEQEKGNA